MKTQRIVSTDVRKNDNSTPWPLKQEFKGTAIREDGEKAHGYGMTKSDAVSSAVRNVQQK